MPEKPVLMLDVDGVLAPFGTDEWCPDGYYERRFGGMSVYLSDHNATRLARLRQYVDLMWATAWEDQANELLLPSLSLEAPLPCIYFDHRIENRGEGPEVQGASRRLKETIFDPGVRTWKLPWIRQWAEMNPTRPFIWVDDEIDKDAFSWADEREIPTLMLRANPCVGFTDAHADLIEQWAKDLDEKEEVADVSG